MHLVLLENITRFPMKYDIHSFTYPRGLIRNNANTICYCLLSHEFYTNILHAHPYICKHFKAIIYFYAYMIACSAFSGTLLVHKSKLIVPLYVFALL